MLDAKQINKLFRALNAELAARGQKGELLLCGGAVMCLVFKARPATKDIDGIFHPAKELRAAAKAVAIKHHVPEDWLNDGAKGFFGVDPAREKYLELSHLRVFTPPADYLLAMKCMSARIDGYDQDDIKTLIEHLRIKDVKKVLDIVERYYPKRLIQPKTQFLIEELLS